MKDAGGMLQGEARAFLAAAAVLVLLGLLLALAQLGTT